MLIGVPTGLMINQSGRAQAAPSNPTASTEPVCPRVQLLSGNRIHAGNGLELKLVFLAPTIPSISTARQQRASVLGTGS